MRNKHFPLWLFNYCAAMRFLIASAVLVISAIVVGGGSSRAERDRSYLETIPLELLVISSVVIAEDCKIAYVRDSSGYYHSVLEGDYVGQNYGSAPHRVERSVGLRLL